MSSCEQHDKNSYKQFISHSLKYKQELQKFQMDISHFFIKLYWELWNLQVLQKLLTSSFSNFKHEKTPLNMIPQSFQALKKLKPRFYSKNKAVHVWLSPDRQVRRPKCTVSSTSAVTLILLTWNHSALTLLHLCVFVCSYWNKVQTAQTAVPKLSQCRVTTKFYSLNRPLNSLNWNVSSAKHYPTSTTVFRLLLPSTSMSK